MKVILPKVLMTISCAMVIIFLTGSAHAQSVVYNSPAANGMTANTFNVTGVKKVTVEAWGGGGAGGGVTANNVNSGGGGGGGTYTLATGVMVSGSVNVIVGAGGAGVTAGNGNPGGTSLFSSTIPVSAVGGSFGFAGIGVSGEGAGGAVTMGITYDGGAGSLGVNSNSGFGGAGGGGAGNGGDGGNAVVVTGGAGGVGAPLLPIPGGMGAPGRFTFGNGISTANLAAGGGGAHNNTPAGGGVAARPGGSGGNGQVVVRYIVISAGTIATCYPSFAAAQAAAVAATTTSDDCAGSITLTATSSGGDCNKVITVTATNACGSESCVMYTTNIIGGDVPPVVFDCGEDVTLAECSTQEAVDAAWEDFLASTTASGGCNGVLSNNAPEDPPSRCGGSVDVTFTYVSGCAEDLGTCTITFEVAQSSAPVITNAAEDETVECDGAGNTSDLETWLENNGGATATSDCEITWSNNFTALSDECGATGFATVTFTATDNCNNTSQTTATFTIEDTTSPSIDDEAEDETVECDGAGNTVELNAWLSSNGGATASDVCGEVTWSNNYDGLSDDCGATGSATVTFTATDDCDNSSQTTAIFTIEDTTNPSIDEAAEDETVECDGAGNLAELNAWLAANGGAEASDICSDVVWTNNFTELSDDCGETGFATVTFTATDDCDNFSQTTATFTIEDTTNPSIDDPAEDETVECDGEGNETELNAWLDSNGGAEASDICSDVVWTNNFTELSDDCGATGFATVTFTATDDCDNSSQTTATFTIEDTTNPSIDEPAADETVECDGAGNSAELNAWLVANGNAEASDICSDVAWSNDFTVLSDDCGATGSATVTFTATDDCDNSSQTTATFTIEDTTNPSINDPALNETVECDGQGNVAELNAWLDSNGGAEASDICSDVVWTNDFTALSDDCGATGSATVTFTATDDCDNFSQTTGTFTIEDTTNPSIDDAAVNETVECDGAGNVAELNAWLDSNGGAEASDICSDVVWTNDFTELSDDCGATGSATVTFTATDDCDNSSQTTATFTIEDTTNPTIDDPAVDATVECDGEGNITELDNWLDSNGGASASDICSDVKWSNDFEGLSDDCGATGTATVTFIATDDCGNSSTTSATFTIEDTVDPTIDVAASDETVECDGEGNLAELNAWLDSNGGASASDICSDVTWSYDFDGLSDECGATGSATVIFTATDDCGNTSQTTATFTIEDTTDPAFDPEASDLTVECDGTGNTDDVNGWLEDNGGAEATDACGAVTWSNDFTAVSDDCGATGSATVTFTATDECGNTSQTTATFTISDETPPVALCQDVTIVLDPFVGSASIEASDIDNGSNDVCGGVTLSISQTEFDCDNYGNTTVTLTVTDDCGNTSTCDATVTVNIDIPLYAICGNNNDKAEICHIPPGNPENLHTICIHPSSLCDHLAHGDYFGACDEEEQALATPVGTDAEAIEGYISHDHSHAVEVITETTDANYQIHVNPNPFNTQTNIQLDLKTSENISLNVFNSTGQRVATLHDGRLDAGSHKFIFDGNELSDGLYFFVYRAGATFETGRIVLQR